MAVVIANLKMVYEEAGCLTEHNKTVVPSSHNGRQHIPHATSYNFQDGARAVGNVLPRILRFASKITANCPWPVLTQPKTMKNLERFTNLRVILAQGPC